MAGQQFIIVAPNVVFAVISLVSLLSFAFLVTRLLRPAHRIEFLLTFYLVLTAAILLLAYLVSGFDRLGSMGWWAAFSVLALLGVLIPILRNDRRRALCLRKIGNLRDVGQRITRAGFRRYDSWLLMLMGAAVLLVMAGNLIIILLLKPTTLDVLEYHLPRVAFYLQHGNMRFFEANYWAQVVHPKVSAALMAYVYLAGGVRDNLTELVQYIAYAASIFALYGIARRLGAPRRGSLFAALTFGLLTICITESATAQNDVLQTALIACTLYFLLAYRSNRQVKYLWLLAVAFALAAGVKATITGILPSLLLVGLAYFLPWKKRPVAARRKAAKAAPIMTVHLGWGAIALAVALCVITLPSGYWDNTVRFGSPFGPAKVTKAHTFQDLPAGDVLRYGAKNLLRYGVDFFGVDGFGPFPAAFETQKFLKAIPKAIFTTVGIDLEARDGTREQFAYIHDNPLATEHISYWGILGFLLIWPIVLLAACGLLRQPAGQWMAIATLLFFAIQAFMSPYDIWHGRYFIVCALFSLPPLAFYIASLRHPAAKVYVSVVIILGCISAVISTVIRNNAVLVPYSVNGQRVLSSFAPLDQVFLNNAQISISQIPKPPNYTEDEFKALLAHAAQYALLYQNLLALKVNYEVHVPKDAVVALELAKEFPTQLLFDDHLKRELIPIFTFYNKSNNSSSGTMLPMPHNASYVVFGEGSLRFSYEKDHDILLFPPDANYGAVYLRPL